MYWEVLQKKLYECGRRIGRQVSDEARRAAEEEASLYLLSCCERVHCIWYDASWLGKERKESRRPADEDYVGSEDPRHRW